MNTRQISEALGAYETAFGRQAAENLFVPNYLADPRFGPALVEAVQAGRPITEEQAVALFGEQPFREQVIGDLRQSAGGTPAFPGWIPSRRLPFVELRTIESEPGIEGEAFVYLRDTGEWCVEDAEEEAVIRAAHPGARFARKPGA